MRLLAIGILRMISFFRDTVMTSIKQKMSESELITRLQATVQVLERARIKQPKSREDMKFNLGLDFAASMVRMDIYAIKNN